MPSKRGWENGWWLAYLQCKALGDFVRVFPGAPITLEDGVPQDVEGVRAAQATKVVEGHRCRRTWSNCFFNFRPSNTFNRRSICASTNNLIGFLPIGNR
jgi:hypothetical protein